MNADEQRRKESVHGRASARRNRVQAMPLIIYRWRVGQRSELFLPRSRWKDAAVLSDISMRMEACACVCVCMRTCVKAKEREMRFVKVCDGEKGEKRERKERTAKRKEATDEPSLRRRACRTR